MANNRAYLKCKACGENRTLLKYYPSTGWYVFAREESLNKWMETHSGHSSGSLDWGGNPFKLEYDNDGE